MNYQTFEEKEDLCILRDVMGVPGCVRKPCHEVRLFSTERLLGFSRLWTTRRGWGKFQKYGQRLDRVVEDGFQTYRSEYGANNVEKDLGF